MSANDDPIHGASSAARLVRNWWQAPKGEVSSVAIAYVQEVDRLQFATFDKFVKLEAMYDTSPRTNVHNGLTAPSRSLGVMTENVIASNIDTVVAQIAATDVRAEFMTDDADWDHQRTAKQLGFYADGLAVTYGVGEKCRAAFKASALKGTGVIKVYVDQFDQIRVDRVLIDNIVVDELECRNGTPRQMHYRDFFDAEDLKAQYPDHADAIEKARGQVYGNTSRAWAGYRPFKENEVVVVESHRLPIGPKGHENYIPGRHSITIAGADLLDEEWHKPFFPYCIDRWNIPERGWYGIGLAERIAGIQNALNKNNWVIEKAHDRAAAPITYVTRADAKLAVQGINQIGQIVIHNGPRPETVVAPILSNETYARGPTLKQSASEECGVSRMASQAVKPAGIDSGVAMREYRDQTTQRFAPQEKGFEQLWLDVITLILDCCKDLDAAAPVVMRRTKYGAQKIKWSQVDMGDVRIQIKAASTLSQTPAGRQQAVVEWAQAGIISQDEARRLMDHPDLERAMSIYTEALDDIEHTIEMIEDGEMLMPEPYQSLPLGVWRCQQEYLKIKNDGAPEAILEALRAWIVSAANAMNPPAPPMPAGVPANANMPAAAGGAGAGSPPGGPQPMPGPAPMPAIGGPAQGAFAPGVYAPMAS